MIGRLFGGMTWLLVGLASVASAADERPIFVKQLTLPVLNDTIGFARSVTVDLTTGEVFVCDTRRDRIVVFDDEGVFSFEISGGHDFRSPADLAIHPRGHLYVLASHGKRRAVQKLDFDGRFIREIPLIGLPEESLEPSLESIAISSAGDRLYVMDSVNLRLWITDLEGRIQGDVDFAEGLTENQREDLMLGRVDVYGDRVVVALTSKGRIQIFDLDGNPVSQHGKKGTSRCKLALPMAAALDSEGVLDIIDQQRMKIVRWSTTTGCIGDYYGLGMRPGFFYFPNDIALDTVGRLYTAQGFAGRVQAYEGVPPAPELPPLAAPDAGADPQAAVEELVRAWVFAREERNADDYLSAYSEDYFPWGVASRRDWRDMRRAQIGSPGWVIVQISDLWVEMIRDDTARATFDEVAQTDSYESRVRRTLTLTLEQGGWRIIEERAATVP